MQAEARAAGYVSIFPASGEGPTLTIEHRCPSCGWTLYANLVGRVYCSHETCAQNGCTVSASVYDGLSTSAVPEEQAPSIPLIAESTEPKEKHHD